MNTIAEKKRVMLKLHRRQAMDHGKVGVKRYPGEIDMAGITRQGRRATDSNPNWKLDLFAGVAVVGVVMGAVCAALYMVIS